MNRLQSLFFAWIFPWVPKRLLSRATGLAMRIPIPRLLAGPVIHAFARFFGINEIDSAKSVGEYRSLDDFFTRQLRPGLRPIGEGIVHPVDGVLTQIGRVTEGEMVQAKGWTYPVAEFLGDPAQAKRFEGGTYFTYYLCPADYHRVHSPCAGDLVSARHIPGLLWPVNSWSVHHIQRLFNLNERVVFNFKSPQGEWSLVMVGATNVGHITVAVDPSITTNRWMWHAPTDRQYSPAYPVRPGDELGTFHLGSTVMCIFAESFNLTSKGFAHPVKYGASL